MTGLLLRRRDAGVEAGVEGPATKGAEGRLVVSFPLKIALIALGGKVSLISFLNGFAARFGSSLLSDQNHKEIIFYHSQNNDSVVVIWFFDIPRDSFAFGCSTSGARCLRYILFNDFYFRIIIRVRNYLTERIEFLEIQML